jgi:type IV secretion system protein TrbD
MTDRGIKGFSVPVHDALVSPILLAGVPRRAAILVGTAGAAISFGLQQPWFGIPVTLVLFWVARRMTRRDHQFLEVVRRMVRQRAFYRV